MPKTLPTTDHRPPIPMLFRNVTIIGLGLMGGSLGLALRERGLAGRVVGYARRPETRTAAVHRGIVEEAAERVGDAVAGADLVVLATPLLSYESLLREALPSLSPGCLVTDLGSTKAHVVRTCNAVLDGSGATFVGGHPMTGSEESGPEAARADLYEGAPWCITPSADTPEASVERVRALAEAVGSSALVLSPEEHDRSVAASSHVPHLAAVALVDAFRRTSQTVPAALQLLAGGFRDTTRVASGSPEMWRDICLSNREGILDTLRDLTLSLGELEAAVRQGDSDRLAELLDRSKAFRDGLMKIGRIPDVLPMKGRKESAEFAPKKTEQVPFDAKDDSHPPQTLEP